MLANCDKLLAGDPDYTFGLSDWRTATTEEVVAAVQGVCGRAATDGEPSGPGYIDPDATVAGVRRQRDRLASFVRSRGGAVLVATGHPTGLLPHYGAVARALAAAGCRVLRPLDDTVLDEQDGQVRGVRFLDGVACPWSGGDLLHTHRAATMVAMLAELERTGSSPDLVIGDHGMAGGAIEAGIPTLSIADVNDPALPLAQARGRTADVLPIDDNLAPHVFVPVTRAVLAGVA